MSTRNTQTNLFQSRFQGGNELSYGQLVLVAARWVLIFVGLVLTIWDPAPVGVLRFQILIVFLMAGGNFYLHAQTLMKRRVSSDLIYAASAADLLVVTAFVLLDGGFRSPLYTFYFPAVMAFAVVFPTGITFLYTVCTAIFYALISVPELFHPSVTALDGKPLQIVVARIIILCAIAVCGNVFLRIERGRRNAAAKAHLDMVSEIGSHERI